MKFEIPRIYVENRVTPYLDDIRNYYFTYNRGIGYIYGIMALDSDAKIIAVDTKFDSDFNIWDICSIGSALYGVGKQAGDLWNENMKKGNLEFDKKKLFVRSVGLVDFTGVGVSREILVIVLADIEIKDGLMILIINRYCDILKKEVKENDIFRPFIEMSEPEYQKEIEKLKKEGLFPTGVDVSIP